MRSASSDEINAKGEGCPKQEQQGQMLFIAESDLDWYSIIT
jgi:hypothetical protein